MAPLPEPPTLTTLLATVIKRQVVTTIVAIPASYGNLDAGPPPGTVVGIVLGSVAGFLLVLWLLYTCFNGGIGGYVDDDVSSVVVRRKSRGTRTTTSRRTGSRRHSETVEVRRERPTPVVPVVIVEERRPRPRAVSVVRSERSADEVVVIEEPSPPRRSKSNRRSSGQYRTVDPMAYGGGDGPVREVRRGSRR
jgi:hypothetical protein